MKLLWVSTRKSVSAVVHAPAPTVVGMRYSRGVSRVKEGSRYFSSTLRRAMLYACAREGRKWEWEKMCRGENVRRTYHGLLACPPLAPRHSANLQTSSGTLCVHSLQSEGYSSHQFLWASNYTQRYKIDNSHLQKKQWTEFPYVPLCVCRRFLKYTAVSEGRMTLLQLHKMGLDAVRLSEVPNPWLTGLLV